MGRTGSGAASLKPREVRKPPGGTMEQGLRSSPGVTGSTPTRARPSERARVGVWAGSEENPP
jgi:hypothetical protein